MHIHCVRAFSLLIGMYIVPLSYFWLSLAIIAHSAVEFHKLMPVFAVLTQATLLQYIWQRVDVEASYDPTRLLSAKACLAVRAKDPQ